MHELRNHDTAMPVHSIGRGTPGLSLLVIGEPGLEAVALGRTAIGVVALGNDQAKTAFGEPLVVARHGLRCTALLVRAHACHGRYRKSVLQFQMTSIERRCNVFVCLAHTANPHCADRLRIARSH